MRVPAIERYTIADYLDWEGDWELIDGVAFAMAPSPLFSHQALGAEIHAQLHDALEDCPHCQALYEIDVRFSEDTVVRPDVIVICHEPEGEWITRAPELIFEVASPKTARRDEVTKFQLYRDEGVAWYGIVYPDLKKAKLWRLVEGDYRKVGDFYDERLRIELSKCAIELDFSRLWRRLPKGNPNQTAP
jgi:Uma2 family endonuclease